VEANGLFDRIRAEYLEMPGMTLRLEQVARLCGIDRSACQAVLDALVEVKFLRVTSNGAYARVTTESTHRPRGAPDPMPSHTATAHHTHRRAS
jgi:hypothetical protein